MSLTIGRWCIAAATLTSLSSALSPMSNAAPAARGDSALAASRSAREPAGKRYYFTWAQVPSHEWHHPFGPCLPLDEAVQSGLRDCRPLGQHQLCDSTFTVELSSGGRHHQFYLAHEIFTTPAACTAQRNQAMQQ